MKWCSSLFLSLLLFMAFAFSASAQQSNKQWSTYDRPPEHEVIKKTNVKITMRDGVTLFADVYHPDGEGPHPVIITQTPYNKDLNEGKDYFVKRGYAYVLVDVRGTGGSGGTWESFGGAEQRDGYEIVEWATEQPWSDGKIGLWGSSYRAINQMFTAAQQPPGLKAIFPIVPMADSYRDIVMTGGLANTGFIPLWLAITTSTGIIPPTYIQEEPVRAVTTTGTRVGNLLTYQFPTVASTLTGGDRAYDGPGHQSRSPIRVTDQIKVPTFIVGGLHDIFQRGEPLLYEKLKKRVHTKLLMGPWTHGDFGSNLPKDGVPNLDQIALQWFDHYLKGINTSVHQIPDVTQYVLGENRYETQGDWPHPDMEPQKMYLREGNKLASTHPDAGENSDIMLQNPVNGTCSGSTNQWLMGLISSTPCAKDNRLTELGEVTYTTDVLEKDLKISGPIGAELYITPSTKEAVLSIRITDVAPDGSSTEITAGWLAGSFRKVEESKSRIVDGLNLQPWHPFTRESVSPLTPGESTKLNIEIFPTNAVIKEGHRLRVAVGPSDFPHAFTTTTQLKNQLGGKVEILHDKNHPSAVLFPFIQN